MHIDALSERAVWFHAMDHTNCGRWIPVHLRDMVEVPTSHPEIAEDRGIDLFSTLEGPVRRSGDGNLQRGRGAHRSGPRAEQCSHQRRWRCSMPDWQLQHSTTVDVGRTRGCQAHQRIPDATEPENWSQDTKHHDQSASVQTAFLKDV